MSKKVNNGIHSAKVEANKTHKSIMGSLNKLQKIAIEYYEGNENPAFKTLCDKLGLAKSDIQFSHVLKFGTNRELNFVDKTGQLTGKKSIFSFWLFESCLVRYANSKQAVKPEAKKQTKQATKTTAKPEVKAKPQITAKTVKIEQKSETTAKPVKVAKVA